eukprot:GFYU01003969.1.p1 GENE.GFYU01003969.1~~GFYU01003969.1.p1  ORF type:complete len:311 (+),score=52.30 GFYU01003969.1:85-933(+)
MFTDLNDVLEWSSDKPVGGQVVLVEDGVELDGNFMLHHFLLWYLKGNVKVQDPKDRHHVTFFAFEQSYAHYFNIARKCGVNMSQMITSGDLLYIDGLSAPFKWSQPGQDLKSLPIFAFPNQPPPELPLFQLEMAEDDVSLSPNTMTQLYERIVESVEKNEGRSVPSCIIIDNLSYLKSCGASDADICTFLQHCRALCTQKNCTIVVLMHSDIPTSSHLSNYARHMADYILKVSALETGVSKDVHGQVLAIVRTPGVAVTRHLHFKTSENNVRFFVKGTSKEI